MGIYLTTAVEARSPSPIAVRKSRFEAFQKTKIYDLLAATPLIGWYGLCVAHQLPALIAQIRGTTIATINVHALASLASQLAALLLIVLLALLLGLRHKPRARMSGLYPRFAAVAGTYLSVGITLLPSRELSAVVSMISTLVVLAGSALSIYAALSLGRSLSMLPEARSLVTRGPYRLIRHPLYLSEATAIVGVTLQYLSPLALALLVMQWVFLLERMKNEEHVLSSTFPEYRDYMTTTARLVPGIY